MRKRGGSQSDIKAEPPPHDPDKSKVVKEVGKADIQSNLIAANKNAIFWKGAALALDDSVDDVEAEFGTEIYDEVQTDPTVQGVLNAMASQIVQSKPTLVPSHSVSKYAEVTKEDEENAAIAELICDFALDSITRIARYGVSNLTLMREVIERSLVRGHCLAECVFEYQTAGRWKGKYLHRSIMTKPRDRYVHIVSGTNELLGVFGIIPGENWALWHGILGKDYLKNMPGFVPATKIFNFAFWPKNGNPVGRSILRGAFRPWQKRKLGDPQDVSNIKICGGGQFSFEAEKGADTSIEAFKTLNEMAANIESFSGMTLPRGWKLVRHNPESGDNFGPYLQRCRVDMVEAIFGAARAFIEANKGSRADSETAQDTSTVVGDVIGDCYRESFQAQVIYPLIEMNWGTEIADKYCPIVVMNQPTNKDIPRMAEAAAHLFSTGALPKSMRQQVAEEWLGLTWQEPLEEEDFVGGLGQPKPKQPVKSGSKATGGIREGQWTSSYRRLPPTLSIRAKVEPYLSQAA